MKSRRPASTSHKPESSRALAMATWTILFAVAATAAAALFVLAARSPPASAHAARQATLFTPAKSKTTAPPASSAKTPTPAPVEETPDFSTGTGELFPDVPPRK
jgi:hypothetical protein